MIFQAYSKCNRKNLKANVMVNQLPQLHGHVQRGCNADVLIVSFSHLIRTAIVKTQTSKIVLLFIHDVFGLYSPLTLFHR